MNLRIKFPNINLMVNEQMGGCLTLLIIKEMLIQTLECHFSLILRNLTKHSELGCERVGALLRARATGIDWCTLSEGPFGNTWEYVPRALKMYIESLTYQLKF